MSSCYRFGWIKEFLPQRFERVQRHGRETAARGLECYIRYLSPQVTHDETLTLLLDKLDLERSKDDKSVSRFYISSFCFSNSMHTSRYGLHMFVQNLMPNSITAWSDCVPVFLWCHRMFVLDSVLQSKLHPSIMDQCLNRRVTQNRTAWRGSSGTIPNFWWWKYKNNHPSVQQTVWAWRFNKKHVLKTWAFTRGYTLETLKM